MFSAILKTGLPKEFQGQAASDPAESKPDETPSLARETVDLWMRSIRTVRRSVASSLWSPGKTAAIKTSPLSVFEIGGACLWRMGFLPMNDGSKKLALASITGHTADSIDGYGEHFLTRFMNPGTGEALIANRDHLETLDPQKPLAVVVYPTADHNKAFDVGGFPLLDTLVGSGKFNVLYYEAKGVKSVRKILDEVTEKSGRKVHTLILGGHGNAVSLALGTDNCSAESKKCLSPDSFTTDDVRHEEGTLLLDRYVEKDGQVVLDSCSTGLGGVANDNLANKVALTLPGRRVYAAGFSGNYKSFSINEDLSLDIVWRDNKEVSKMYVATAAKIETFHRLEGVKKSIEDWAKRLKEDAGKEEVNPGTMAKGAPYSRFVRDYYGKHAFADTFESHELPSTDEARLVEAVRAKVDAFLKRNPGWTAGAVFEYAGGFLKWDYAREIRSLYVDGRVKDPSFLMKRSILLYLPTDKAARAFAAWKGK